MSTTPVIRKLTVSDGYSLHFRYWAPDSAAGNCRGIVLPLHGIQSHSGWYDYSSQRMAAAGYAVYFADRRGSGLNGFQRGHAVDAMRLIHDVRSLRKLALDEHPSSQELLKPELQHGSSGVANSEVPSSTVTIMGISWGGKIAAAACALFPQEFQRLALLYPGLESRYRLTLWQRLRLNLARDFEVVRRHIPIPLDDPAMFTQVPEWQSFIAQDPLALHTVTSSFLNSGRKLDQIIKVGCRQITQPALLMLAEDDTIIDNVRVRERVNSFGCRSLKTHIFRSARHTLEFEPDREFVFSELLAWMNEPV